MSDPTLTSSLQALLGKGTRFEGHLVFQDRVRIDGQIKGTIEGDGILVLGDSADIDATIRVDTLIVRGGTLRGVVHAKEVIEVRKDAKVFADLHAPSIEIEKGCLFEGRCMMSST